MKDYLLSILLLILVTLALALAFVWLPRPRGVWIDCRISEISPDYTTEMREACRKANSQQIGK
jgi:hypothetical protein